MKHKTQKEREGERDKKKIYTSLTGIFFYFLFLFSLKYLVRNENSFASHRNFIVFHRCNNFETCASALDLSQQIYVDEIYGHNEECFDRFAFNTLFTLIKFLSPSSESTYFYSSVSLVFRNLLTIANTIQTTLVPAIIHTHTRAHAYAIFSHSVSVCLLL